MKNLFPHILAIFLPLMACATTKDVRIPQTPNNVSWINVTISPAANSLLGFANDKTVANVTAGTGITIAGGVISAPGTGGTVTSIPDGSTNGVTWTVATRTTTPTFTFSFGAITPTSVNGAKISFDGGDGNFAAGTSFLSLAGGLENTAVGDGALDGVMGGSGNTAAGQNALTTLNSGSANSAFGGLALSGLTTGGSNTAIGVSALSAVTTTDGNVALGYSAGSRETGSNKLFIDNQDRGSEANGRTKSLLYGEFDADPANQRLTVNAELVASTGVIKGGATAIMPIQVYVKNVTVLTAGAPADIATISIPAGITRYILPGSVTAQDAGLIVAETAAGSLANGFFHIRDAAAGAGNQLTDSRTGPTGASTKGSWSPQSSSVVYTSQTLSVRQTVASLNAGTCSFYVTIFPLP